MVVIECGDVISEKFVGDAVESVVSEENHVIVYRWLLGRDGYDILIRFEIDRKLITIDYSCYENHRITDAEKDINRLGKEIRAYITPEELIKNQLIYKDIDCIKDYLKETNNVDGRKGLKWIKLNKKTLEVAVPLGLITCYNNEGSLGISVNTQDRENVEKYARIIQQYYRLINS